MTEQEQKKEAFMAKAIANRKNFDLHVKLIKEHLCVGGKEYIDDLKEFYLHQNVDNFLLIKLMEYAEEYARNAKSDSLTECNCTNHTLQTWCCDQCRLPTNKISLRVRENDK